MTARKHNFIPDMTAAELRDSINRLSLWIIKLGKDPQHEAQRRFWSEQLEQCRAELERRTTP